MRAAQPKKKKTRSRRDERAPRASRPHITLSECEPASLAIELARYLFEALVLERPIVRRAGRRRKPKWIIGVSRRRRRLGIEVVVTCVFRANSQSIYR
jgi:hypothetical protein